MTNELCSFQLASEDLRRMENYSITKISLTFMFVFEDKLLLLWSFVCSSITCTRGCEHCTIRSRKAMSSVWIEWRWISQPHHCDTIKSIKIKSLHSVERYTGTRANQTENERAHSRRPRDNYISSNVSSPFAPKPNTDIPFEFDSICVASTCLALLLYCF